MRALRFVRMTPALAFVRIRQKTFRRGRSRRLGRETDLKSGQQMYVVHQVRDSSMGELYAPCVRLPCARVLPTVTS